jgi:hypothetical protein
MERVDMMREKVEKLELETMKLHEYSQPLRGYHTAMQASAQTWVRGGGFL